ncbi:hypothetical protein Godav_010339 [Gossypium davidsonii]|uniref:Uncharacterized protein n=1 Tax=Gossypium davidsonii TaxID=34287 RepID=A0A7J8SG93_GOSDV|nr:hypothetical protein [Gossypium davidsonii]
MTRQELEKDRSWGSWPKYEKRQNVYQDYSSLRKVYCGYTTIRIAIGRKRPRGMASSYSRGNDNLLVQLDRSIFTCRTSGSPRFPLRKERKDKREVRIRLTDISRYLDYGQEESPIKGMTSWRDQPGSDKNGDRKQLKSICDDPYSDPADGLGITTLPTVEFTVGVNLSGSNISVGWETNKVHIRLDLPPNADDLTVEANGQ